MVEAEKRWQTEGANADPNERLDTITKYLEMAADPNNSKALKAEMDKDRNAEFKKNPALAAQFINDLGTASQTLKKKAAVLQGQTADASNPDPNANPNPN